MRIRPDEIQTIAGDRRLALAILVLLPTLIGTWALSQTLPFGGRHLLEILLLGLFAILLPGCGSACGRP